MWIHEAFGDGPGRSRPFGFLYGGVSSAEALPNWPREEHCAAVDADRVLTTTAFTDPATGLRVTCEAVSFRDFPAAAEWVLWFENTGATGTPIIRDIQALDLTLDSPIHPEMPFVLHRTNGAPSNATDFEVSAVPLRDGAWFTLGAGGGRSSNKDFPFFRVDTARGALIVAVGWSGQWQATLRCLDGARLRATAGMELTRFRLHPGERVRTPRILALFHEGDQVESHSAFRRLIYKHYAARFRGERPLPFLYCNTCFTRKGAWLNECNEQNQISLIHALAPLGIHAVITDAGWFEGGWPKGRGNWTPRKDAYPNGLGPVAAAAKQHGMIYGLWFEPETIVAGTATDRDHPDWLLRAEGCKDLALLNMGLPEARNAFFDVVKGFMALPGFRCYRQDFNRDPLAHWRDNDAPDRQGITEIKYVMGLYAYWDRIIEAFPDSYRVECAGGGRRIDLETVMRFHVHQKSDYWFHNVPDQSSLFALSHYLPNSLVMTPIDRLDTYTFHSVLASSVCLGWIADAPGFDLTRATELADRYRRVRHLLVGDWYPLTPYHRSREDWLAGQYHRPDLDEGLVLVFRREDTAGRDWQRAFRLRGLDPAATYRLEHDTTRESRQVSGADLAAGLVVQLHDAPASDMIHYRRL